MEMINAVVFRGVNTLAVEEVPKPQPRAGEALIRITATTICGTDVHIVKGEYPVRPGLILGHEPTIDLTPLVTHRFALEDIQEAYEVFSRQQDGVPKTALYPSGVPFPAAAHEYADALC